MKNIFAFIIGFTVLSHAATVQADKWATIECKFDINRYGRDKGLKVVNQEGHWDLVYSNCKDGDQSYHVTFVQHKVLNLDFLLDKNNITGFMKLLCFGTDVRGTYRAGLQAGVSLAGSLSLSAFLSVRGEQAFCMVGRLGAGMNLGAEISPYSLIIENAPAAPVRPDYWGD